MLERLQSIFPYLIMHWILFTISRWIFYACNADIFPALSFSGGMHVLLSGIRYDTLAILWVNIPLFLMHCVPILILRRKQYKRWITTWFVFITSLIILSEGSDYVYFRYGMQRLSTHELGLLQDLRVLPRALMDLWPVLLSGVLLIWFGRKFSLPQRSQATPIASAIQVSHRKNGLSLALGVPVLLLTSGISLCDRLPFHASMPTLDADPAFHALKTNSSYSVIHAFLHRNVEELPCPDANDLPQQRLVMQQPAARLISQTVEPVSNICVIILESFSKEYVGFFTGEQRYTPFLDSLMHESLVFTRFYANGKSSNQGIAAITAGIPVLMHEPFMSSLYKDNRIDGIGDRLQQKGYTTAFFHGAEHGSMGFNTFMEQAGIQHYYGREEYGPHDYDGYWGVYDAPFLQWTCAKMSEMSQPFYAQIFTLSSHYPYHLPAQCRGKYPQGSIPMLEVVAYTDDALRTFFAQARHQPWFESTLFILTADHTGPPLPGSATNSLHPGMHETWLSIYHPDSQFCGLDHRIAQQTDIHATVLDYAGIQGATSLFGQSVFDENNVRYAFHMHSGTYMLLDEAFVLLHDGVHPVGLYRYPEDPLLKNDLRQSEPEEMMQRTKVLMELLCRHHQAMREDALVVDQFN